MSGGVEVIGLAGLRANIGKVHCKNRISAPKVEEYVLDLLRRQAPDQVFLQGFMDEVELLQKDMRAHYEPKIQNVSLALKEAKAEEKKYTLSFCREP
ncbi:MAG: hypothetical protein J6S58_09785 [Lentisphaeria bacterium]|nr:hypothetical protein [Lentisphaeria bacterium]